MNSASKLLMLDLPGPNLDADTLAHLKDVQPGGIILFRRNIASRAAARKLTDELRNLLGQDLLIAVDQEGGAVLRTTDLPNTPSAMNLGAGDSEEDARDCGAVLGRGLLAMGANWDFAPVLDVNSNPNNPVIADRSFGQDPALVARLGIAFAQGLADAGVAACGKHFPGHGDTAQDSHHDLPSVPRSRRELEAVELAPFKAAIAAGLPSIMTAHVMFPALDPEHPATLSRKILTHLLREQWGFEGVIVTDAMDMKAIAERYGRGDAAVTSILAGADMVEALGPREAQMATVSAVREAAASGRLSEDRVRASIGRLDRLKARFAVPTAERFVYDAEQEAADRRVVESVWRRGVVAVGSPRLPEAGRTVILVAPAFASGNIVAENGIRATDLEEILAKRNPVRLVAFEDTDPLSVAPLVQAARDHNPGAMLIFASTGRHRLSDPARALAASARPDLHLAVWNPFTVADVAAPALVTFGFRPEALLALEAVLAGSPITGKPPIALQVAVSTPSEGGRI